MRSMGMKIYDGRLIHPLSLQTLLSQGAILSRYFVQAFLQVRGLCSEFCVKVLMSPFLSASLLIQDAIARDGFVRCNSQVLLR